MEHDRNHPEPPPPPVGAPITTFSSPPVLSQHREQYGSRPPELAEESPLERRERSGLLAAIWIGLIGSGLIVLALIGIVVSEWDAIGEMGRAIGLSILGLGTLAAAFRIKQLTPSTAGLLVHLDDVVIGAMGVSIMSALGFGWPSCLLVGGSMAALAAIELNRRWSPSTFVWFEVGAISIAAFGCAALVHQVPLTVGLLVAVASIVQAGLGRYRQAAILAIVAVSTPLVSILSASGIGTGTLLDAGAVGDRLVWSGPVVGVVTSLVLWRAASELCRPWLRQAAAAAILVGLATGLIAAGINSTAVVMSIPGALLLIVATGQVSSGGETRNTRNKVSDAIAVAVGVIVVSPWGFLAIVFSVVLSVPVDDGEWDLSGAPFLTDRIEWMAFPAVSSLLGLALWWWSNRPGEFVTPTL